MNPKRDETEARIVSLFAPATEGTPDITPQEKADQLEDLLRMADLLGPSNNQNGTGKKNPSKEVRAERRRKKLARKANRYGR